MEGIIGDMEHVLATIRHNAMNEARRVKAEAEQEAEQARKQAEQEAERARRQILDQARREAEKIRRQRRAGTARQAREQYLRVREELLGEVWRRAEQQLRSLIEDEKAYADVLKRLCLQAAEAFGASRTKKSPAEERGAKENEKEETVRLVAAADPKGHDLLGEKRLRQWSREVSEAAGLEISLERAEQPLRSWGGLVLSQAGKERQIDETFPSRLELAAEEARQPVFERLEGS
jgi:colicin import membrane protein